jgi:hypothetical protein
MCRSPREATGGIELAEIVRQVSARLDDDALCAEQRKALRAIVDCRTAALGGHVERCEGCGVELHRYHSCRNRHCPKCQALAKERWVQKRQAELLPAEYFHVVFTLPHALNRLAQWQPQLVYGLLFASAAQTLLEVGRNPRWLGAELGVTAVLHTWGQRLDQHIHVHCIVTGGGLSDDGKWRAAKPHFLFPVRVLSKVFRGKYLAALKQQWQSGAFDSDASRLDDIGALLTELRSTDWVVYAKPPFGGPEQVLRYLGRYTHRVAIGNHRLLSLEDGQVRFRWRDYAHGNKQKVMALDGPEFLRRFLLHVLPKGFTRIRHYGLLANRMKRERLAAAREALDTPSPEAPAAESAADFILRVLGVDIHRCPQCHGRLFVVATLTPTRRRQATGPPRETQ